MRAITVSIPPSEPRENAKLVLTKIALLDHSVSKSFEGSIPSVLVFLITM